ncbi:MAG: hypothetical protein LVQ95_00345 [Candidatus Micrarchaeales archaeon]|nr:hypothetical protein [Candidatus Micrarchaeales archaeon]
MDVKGLRDKSEFLLGNDYSERQGHYYIFVSFLNEFGDTQKQPAVYVVPAQRISALVKKYRGHMQGVRLSDLEKLSKQFYYNWRNLKCGATNVKELVKK